MSTHALLLLPWHATCRKRKHLLNLPGYILCVMACREPETWIPAGVPRIMLSQSDFHDPERRDSGELPWCLSSTESGQNWCFNP